MASPEADFVDAKSPDNFRKGKEKNWTSLRNFVNIRLAFYCIWRVRRGSAKIGDAEFDLSAGAAMPPKDRVSVRSHLMIGAFS
jgi:hypothetical protein